MPYTRSNKHLCKSKRHTSKSRFRSRSLKDVKEIYKKREKKKMEEKFKRWKQYNATWKGEGIKGKRHEREDANQSELPRELRNLQPLRVHVRDVLPVMKINKRLERRRE